MFYGISAIPQAEIHRFPSRRKETGITLYMLALSLSGLFFPV